NLQVDSIGLKTCSGFRHDGLDLECNAGIVEREKLWIPHPDLKRYSTAGIIGLRFSSQFNPVRNIGDQPAHHLAPGFVHVLVCLGVVKTPVPKIAQGERGSTTAAKTLHDQRRVSLAFRVGNIGDDLSSRFSLLYTVEHLEWGHALHSSFFITFIVTQTGPGLK